MSLTGLHIAGIQKEFYGKHEMEGEVSYSCLLPSTLWRPCVLEGRGGREEYICGICLEIGCCVAQTLQKIVSL